MPSVGIRELKAQTSAIVRQVAEERAPYTITHHGKPVAMIVPIDEVADTIEDATERQAAWDRFALAVHDIRADWPADVDPVELLSDMRR